MKKYLILGNGVAGTTAAAEIQKIDPHGRIVMLTREDTPFYSRIKLPDYVAGLKNRKNLIIRNDQWYTDKKIELHTGTDVIKIEPDKKQVLERNGRAWEFDDLLIATGSHSFIPPVKGSDLDNVFALRTINDADRIITVAENAENAVLIGGGLLGLEAAHALIKRGLKVTVVEFFDRLLPRQMDNEGAELLKSMLKDLGFAFKLGANTSELKGDKKVEKVMLESGEGLRADMVLFSAGVRSTLDLIKDLDLETDKGIIVNETMATSINHIFAAGDVAEFNKANFCIWPEAQEQGRIAGAAMAGDTSRRFKQIVPSNRLKVAGIDLASAGEIDPDGVLDSEIEKTDQIYKKIVKKQGKPVGCIMLGSTDGFSALVREMGI
ncbi:MAG: FAD-dependent oxidoreductase [Thermodesulfobacteriota bacterium]|nr:FAD-dependent oxidoreductase [Thermodesulfobacteriota bacterium]